MKNLSITLLSLGLFSILLVSCKADEGLKDELGQIEKLKKEVMGEWIFRDADARLAADASSSIEFMEGNTFVVEMGEEALSSEYEVRSATGILLHGFGELENIALNGGSIAFTMTNNGRVTSVEAEKTPEMSQDEKTGLLCRKWQLLPLENGIDSLNYVHRSFMTFSTAGTYLNETYSREDSPLPGTRKVKWKWHPTVENRIQYWIKGDEPTEDYNYIDIRELTATSLKITNSNYDGESDYSLAPVD